VGGLGALLLMPADELIKLKGSNSISLAVPVPLFPPWWLRPLFENRPVIDELQLICQRD
jgi:hypothetical protein